jgi:hypothetical protein
MWRGAGGGGGMCDRREPFGGLSRRVLRAVGQAETSAAGNAGAGASAQSGRRREDGYV